MKVRINNKLYNSDDEPILLILSDNDKKSIKSLPKDVLSFSPNDFKVTGSDDSRQGLIMFGLIRKSSISNHIKSAEKRACKRTAKEYQVTIRKKNDEIRKLRQQMKRIQKGYALYREQRDGYKNMSADMQRVLLEFQNGVNRAICSFKGNFDDLEYQIYLDSRKDGKVLKLIE